jgi:hypothetical protein
MSHDGQAIRALQVAGEPVAVPVLRFVDVLALGLELGVISADDCRRALGTLKGFPNEYVPHPLRTVPKEQIASALLKLDRRLRVMAAGVPKPAPQRPSDVLYVS